MISEDRLLILDAFGDSFDSDMGRFPGLLGTDIVNLSGGTYEIATKSVSVMVETTLAYSYELNPGASFTYTRDDLTYTLTITSLSDTLDGWTELFCDVGVNNY